MHKEGHKDTLAHYEIKLKTANFLEVCNVSQPGLEVGKSNGMKGRYFVTLNLCNILAVGVFVFRTLSPIQIHSCSQSPRDSLQLIFMMESPIGSIQMRSMVNILPRVLALMFHYYVAKLLKQRDS